MIRATVPSSHRSPAPNFAVCVWVNHGSKVSLSHPCPSLMVTSSSQLRRVLWECLGKPATSSHQMLEHLRQVSTENSRRRQETRVEHVLTLQSKMWHGQSYHRGFGNTEGCGNKTQGMQNGTFQTCLWRGLTQGTPLFSLQMKEKPSFPNHI